jgi:hypothetical protein
MHHDTRRTLRGDATRRATAYGDRPGGGRNMRSCNAGRRRSRRVAAAQTFGSLLSTSPFELYNRHKAEARQKQLPLILYARGDRPVPSALAVGLSRGPIPAMRFDGINVCPLRAARSAGTSSPSRTRRGSPSQQVNSALKPSPLKPL